MLADSFTSVRQNGSVTVKRKRLATNVRELDNFFDEVFRILGIIVDQDWNHGAALKQRNCRFNIDDGGTAVTYGNQHSFVKRDAGDDFCDISSLKKNRAVIEGVAHFSSENLINLDFL